MGVHVCVGRAQAAVTPPGFAELITKTRLYAERTPYNPPIPTWVPPERTPMPFAHALRERGPPEVAGGDRRRPEATGGEAPGKCRSLRFKRQKGPRIPPSSDTTSNKATPAVPVATDTPPLAAGTHRPAPPQ